MKLTLLETAQRIHEGLAFLQARDSDRASEDNMIGFSGGHTGIGHDLANLGYMRWTHKQFRAAYNVARVYKNTQLVWIQWANLSVPSDSTQEEWARATMVAPAKKIARISASGDKILVHFSYSADMIALLKQHGARYEPTMTSKAESVWSLGKGSQAAKCVEVLVTTRDFVADAEVTGVLERLFAFFRTAPIQEPKPTWDGVVPGFTGTLRPFQRTGVEWLAEKQRSILADDMGTGKTLQSLAAVHVADQWPLLVVCPAIVKINWLKEAKMWFPNLRITSIGDKKPVRFAIGRERYEIESNDLSAQMIVINYDILGKHMKSLLARGFKSIICDEAHYLKTPDTQRTKCVRYLATGWDTKTKTLAHDGIPMRLLLTGTPVLNRPIELVSILGIAGALQSFGGFKGFTNRYCAPVHNGFAMDYGGAANLLELNSRLRNEVMLRRTKAEVLPDLPEKTRTIVPVEISNAAEYRKAERAVAQWIAKQVISDKGWLQEQREIARGAVNPDAWMDEAIAKKYKQATDTVLRAEELVKYSALKKLAAIGKREAINAWIENFLEDGCKKLVVFAHHTEVVDLIASDWDALKITGSTSMQDRQDAVDKFQNDPSRRIIVCNIRAGGVGITLTAASDVLFVEQDWNPGTHDQAEDRVNRIGQKNACTAWYMIGTDTIDEDIAALIDKKRRVVNAATDGNLGDEDEDVMASVTSGIVRRSE